ncbi:hypothetical protein [Methylobacterium pseudosasicola]|uniref:Uncharacterized protein n=1 Tax=Methylobacterium pseudosasicola TaxID=582667 RepID=A0A1I4Q4T0_9HYPH|nr:hypothetical protein [Methylobacterium pseudosasicola]SFM34633.1 hypothetical protein SAMN05192568_10284 [Methylobacterium pseudosasicola]
MLDVIACLLLSAGIMVGTTYLPVPSEAVGNSSTGLRTSLADAPTCPAKPVQATGAHAQNCLG